MKQTHFFFFFKSHFLFIFSRFYSLVFGIFPLDLSHVHQSILVHMINVRAAANNYFLDLSVRKKVKIHHSFPKSKVTSLTSVSVQQNVQNSKRFIFLPFKTEKMVTFENQRVFDSNDYSVNFLSINLFTNRFSSYKFHTGTLVELLPQLVTAVIKI